MSTFTNEPPMGEEERVIEQVVESTRHHQGFLPIKTNLFDRYFISVVCLVAIHLFWMRFLEASLPLEIATVISIALGFVIVRRG